MAKLLQYISFMITIWGYHGSEYEELCFGVVVPRSLLEVLLDHMALISRKHPSSELLMIFYISSDYRHFYLFALKVLKDIVYFMWLKSLKEILNYSVTLKSLEFCVCLNAVTFPNKLHNSSKMILLGMNYTRDGFLKGEANNPLLGIITEITIFKCA